MFTIKNVIEQQKAFSALRKKKFKIKKAPKVKTTKSLELQYYNEIKHRVLDHTFNAINEYLMPRLNDIVTLYKTYMKLDDYDDEITKSFNDIKLSTDIYITDNTVRGMAQEYANKTNAFNKQQFAKQMQTIIGINVLGAEPDLEPLISSFVNNNVSLIQSIPIEYHRELETKVRTYVEKGISTKKLREEIEATYNKPKARAQLIARDQISKYNGRLTQIRQTNLGIEQYEWSTSNDERVRPSHRAKEGKIFNWNEPPIDTGHPGEDIQCFPGSVYLDAFKFIDVLYRRFYTGKLTKLVFDDNSFLLATPNHPIFTVSGLKAIDSINCGENVVAAIDNRVGTVNNNNQNFKISFEQVFNSFNASFIQKSTGKSTDFHNDGIDQEIDIIKINSLLVRMSDFFSYKKFFELGFSNSDMAICYCILSGFGNKTFLLKTFKNSFTSFMSRFNLICSLLTSHFTPFELFCFALSPYINTSFYKIFPDDISRDHKMFSNHIFAYSLLVHGANFVNRQFNSTSFPCLSSEVYRSINSESSEILADNIRINVDFSGNLLESKSLGIKSNCVVNKTCFNFSGHIYNLQTSNNYYITQNVLVSNCRCVAIPIIEE